MSAALVGSADIHLVHKLMQHGGRQFPQVWIFLCPGNELLNAVSLVFLPGNLLLQELHFLRQFGLFILIIGGQLFKPAVIDFAGDVILIEPLEQPF